MNLIMLITLVVIFAVILSMRRARRRPRVSEIDRMVTRKKEGNGE